MTHDDPPSSKDTPPELARVIRALRQEADDAARLRRVADKLGPLLDAPAAVSSAVGGARKLSLLSKYVLVGATLAAAGFWLSRTKSPAAQPRAATESIETSPPPIEELATGSAATEISAEPAPSESPAAPLEKSRAKARLRPVRLAPQAATAADDAIRDSAQTDRTDVPNSVANTPLGTPDSTDASTQARQENEPPQRSEAALLLEARKLTARDPRAALALLDEHRQRFSTGMLAPERTVLTIEALQNLGRYTEADALLRDFRARNPESVHLRRLENREHNAETRQR